MLDGTFECSVSCKIQLAICVCFQRLTSLLMAARAPADEIEANLAGNWIKRRPPRGVSAEQKTSPS
jgi:hypothetical protein